MEGAFKLSKNLTSLRFMKQAEAQKIASRGVKRKLQTEQKPAVQEDVSRQKIKKVKPQIKNKPLEVHTLQIPLNQSNNKPQLQNFESNHQNQKITDQSGPQLAYKSNGQNQQLSGHKLKQIQNKEEIDLPSKVGDPGPITSGRMSFEGRGQVIENIGLKRIRTVGAVKPRNQQQRKTWEQMVKELDSNQQET